MIDQSFDLLYPEIILQTKNSMKV